MPKVPSGRVPCLDGVVETSLGSWVGGGEQRGGCGASLGARHKGLSPWEPPT